MTNPDELINPVLTSLEDTERRFLAEMNGGLTKREYFAALAMQALINRAGSCATWEDFTGAAICVADALIKELNKMKSNI